MIRGGRTFSTLRWPLVVAVALAVGVASLGLAEGRWSQASSVAGTFGTEEADVLFVAAFTDDDGQVDNPELDPDDDGVDPGYDKAVAACIAALDTQGDAQITVGNGYPSYTCRFWVTAQNVGLIPLRFASPEIETPSELTVLELNPVPCGVLHAGESEVEAFSVHIEQQAAQRASYSFAIRKTFTQAEAGTVGFWRNWEAHKTYPKEEIETWLAAIAADSDWLSATTVEEMEDVFKDGLGKKATPESRFLAQYLATRLNAEANLLCGEASHDFSSLDPDDYLGLGGQATLNEIIAAIESKFDTSPTDAAFNVMKDVCDALNNLEI